MLIMSVGKRESSHTHQSEVGRERGGRGEGRREGRREEGEEEGAGRKEGKREEGEEEGEEEGAEEGEKSIPKLTTSNTLRALSSAAVHSSRPSPVTATDVTLPVGETHHTSL